MKFTWYRIAREAHNPKLQMRYTCHVQCRCGVGGTVKDFNVFRYLLCSGGGWTEYVDVYNASSPFPSITVFYL